MTLWRAWDKGCTCTWLLSIQTTQLSSFLHNQGENVWTCCDWEIQVTTSGLELVFSPPQLNVLPMSFDAPSFLIMIDIVVIWINNACPCSISFTIFTNHLSKVQSRVQTLYYFIIVMLKTFGPGRFHHIAPYLIVFFSLFRFLRVASTPH